VETKHALKFKKNRPYNKDVFFSRAIKKLIYQRPWPARIFRACLVTKAFSKSATVAIISNLTIRT